MGVGGVGVRQGSPKDRFVRSTILETLCFDTVTWSGLASPDVARIEQPAKKVLCWREREETGENKTPNRGPVLRDTSRLGTAVIAAFRCSQPKCLFLMGCSGCGACCSVLLQRHIAASHCRALLQGYVTAQRYPDRLTLSRWGQLHSRSCLCQFEPTAGLLSVPP